MSPHGGVISKLTLAMTMDNLNKIIRHSGRSAKELVMSHDQVSGHNLQINDKELSDMQNEKG